MGPVCRGQVGLAGTITLLAIRLCIHVCVSSITWSPRDTACCLGDGPRYAGSSYFSWIDVCLLGNAGLHLGPNQGPD